MFKDLKVAHEEHYQETQLAKKRICQVSMGLYLHIILKETKED